MKLQQNTNTIVRSGPFEESNYTIEASAKAFSILSDGLYANKIEAVVRELSTNAYDAHVDAGHPDKPFLVHLPNRFSPKFSIRDYGTGLSHEDCMNLYTTYFGSNKTNSNDAIGCLGLGSKSPFAYTDNFIVTSYFNGEMRVYNSYKNENNEPVFALISEDDVLHTPNGMEITFSVEQNDIDEFEEAAQKIYKFFKVLPILDKDDEDNEPLEIDDETEYVIHGSNWGLVKSEGRGYYSHGAVSGLAIMGQVAYPFDYEQFDDESVQSLLKSEVHIHFAIGELDITPSREALSYNESTKRAIKETCECILLEMKEVIEESFDECETLHAARMKYYKLKDAGNVLNRVVGIFDIADVTWNETPLWDTNTLSGGMLRIDLPSKMTGGKVRHIFRDDWKVALKAEHTTSIRFDHRKDMHFVYDDLKRGGLGRAKEFIRNKVGTDKYSNNNADLAYLFTGGLTKEEVIELLSCKESDLILTSTLPSPTEGNRRYSSSGEARSKVAKWNGHWVDTEIDISQGGYYVEINRYEVVNLEGNRGTLNVRRLVEAMMELGYEGFDHESYQDVEIYGIKSQELKKKKFNKDDNWINLLELAKEFYKSVVPDMLEWRADYNFFNHTNHSHDELKNIKKHMVDLPEKLDDYMKSCVKHEGRKAFVNNFTNLATAVDHDIYNYYSLNLHGIHDGDRKLCDKANPWPALWEEATKDYLLLKLILNEVGSYTLSDDEENHWENIVEYIKMVERCKKTDSLLK